MSIIKNITKELENIVKQVGYEVENLVLQPSGRKDLGQYQLNDAMPLAKKYGKNPRMIAEEGSHEFFEDLINEMEDQNHK